MWKYASIYMFRQSKYIYIYPKYTLHNSWQMFLQMLPLYLKKKILLYFILSPIYIIEGKYTALLSGKYKTKAKIPCRYAICGMRYLNANVVCTYVSFYSNLWRNIKVPGYLLSPWSVHRGIHLPHSHLHSYLHSDI